MSKILLYNCVLRIIQVTDNDVTKFVFSPNLVFKHILIVAFSIKIYFAVMTDLQIVDDVIFFLDFRHI